MTEVSRHGAVFAAAEEAGSTSGGSIASIPSDALVILSVRDTVLLPGTVFPITVNRERSVAAAQQAAREERQVGLVMQRDSAVEDPSAIDLHRVGTVANILRYVSTPDGAHHIVLQGVQRFRILEFVRERPFFVARVERQSDCAPLDCVSSCNGVTECSCTLSPINRCIHKRTLIERPARCQHRPFCRVLHCRPVSPSGRTKLTR